MIGCIGTAPSEAGSTFMPAYPFGGNMDLREMEPGTTVYLPVNVAGGLLSMGDLHAAMGSAEPTWVSLEAAGQATLGSASSRPWRCASAAAPRRRRSSWASPIA
jgi:amidase